MDIETGLSNRCLPDCYPLNCQPLGFRHPNSSKFINFSTKKLVMVQYPGYIKNVDKMLETLGGKKGITQTHYKKKCRLQMTYRPEDLNTHFICADLVPSTGLLMKVKRRKNKETAAYEYQQEILGITKQSYKFQTLMDYQTLAPEPLWGYFKSIHGSELLDQNIPAHFPPSTFGRIDTCGNYNYRPNPAMAEKNFLEEFQNGPAPEEAPGVSRKRRQTESQAALFDGSAIFKPSTKAIANIELLKQGPDADVVDKIGKLFEERPLWSKAALMCHVPASIERYKKILPYFSYYWVNGPWRTLWCRMGYDPRKDPNAKIYQLLEVRIRNNKDSTAYNFSHLVPKRSCMNYIPRNLQTRSATKGTSGLAAAKEGIDEPNKDLFPYIFTTTKPIYTRYMMYQLCDLNEPNAQKYIHGNDGKETVCTDKDGWFEPGVLNNIRECIIKAAGEYFRNREGISDIQSKMEENVEETDEEGIDSGMNEEYFGENFSYLQMLNEDLNT